MAQHDYEAMLSQGVSLPVALGRFEQGGRQSTELGECPSWASCRLGSAVLQAEEQGGRSPLRVALLGHAYNLYDDYVNHRVALRLRSLDVDLVTSDAVPPHLGRQSIEGLQWKTGAMGMSWSGLLLTILLGNRWMA